MQKTKNLKLNKPDYTDVADISIINGNMDILDDEIASHKHNAIEITSNTDLNNIDEEGYYWCNSGSSSTVTNKPDDVTFFGLRVTKISGGVFSQEIVTSDNRKFLRIHWSGSWTQWTQITLSGHKHTKADISDFEHNHTLSSLDGVLPISKGGTGQTTAANTRTALGLGTAATRAYTTSVSNGSTSLVTSGAVYNAIKNTKSRTHVVVATFNTQNPLKANADYTCTETNASSILKTAINAVAKGGTVELLDGIYNLQYSEDAIEITKAITIKGCGWETVINQPVDESVGEAKSAFVISSTNVRLKSFMLCDYDISSPVQMITQQAQGTIYEDIFFIFNGSEESGNGTCILGTEDCNYTRIQNCRVYKSFNNSEKAMFDFSLCTNFGGVIGTNISSGYNNISVKFKSETHKNNTAIYGHKAIDLLGG